LSVPEFQPTDQAIGEVHSTIIQQLLLTGCCPDRFQLAKELSTDEADVTARLRRLEQTHGIVLHPHEPEPWVVHPFSLTPTLHWVNASAKSWWAPCIWCALGVATLAKGHVEIHTRLGAEGEPLILRLDDGQVDPLSPDLVVHFSVPPRLAWENVHRHCALVLPFRNEQDVVSWCERHGQAFGEAVPIGQVARLAGAWYGTYADADWRKWNVSQAQDIFRICDLTSPFWQLEGDGTY